MSSPMRWGAPPPRGGGWGGGGGNYHILGLYIRKPIAWLMAGILFTSIGTAVVPAIAANTPLETGHVWSAQVWRLVTWSLLELNPLGLIFELLMVYFFSPDLIARWGVR